MSEAPAPKTDAAPPVVSTDAAPLHDPTRDYLDTVAPVLDPIITRLEAIRLELSGLPLAELLSGGRRERFGEVRDKIEAGLREIIDIAIAERDERHAAAAVAPKAENPESPTEESEVVEIAQQSASEPVLASLQFT